MKIPNIPGAAEIQGFLNGLVSKYKDYVDYVTYLPDDSEPPQDHTHVVSIRSKDGAKAEVAIKVKGIYSMLLNFLLGRV